MRHILVLFVMFFSLSSLTALAGINDPGTGINDPEDGTGSIKGQITTLDGKPAAGVTVEIIGSAKGAITDDKGNFEFRRLQPRSYTLQISLVGYETMEQSVTVEADKATTVSFELKVPDKQLQEVVVVSSLNKFGSRKSNDVAKMPLRNLENPQVYTSITKELLADQLVFSVDDAMRNTPGLTKMWDATGRGGDGGSFYNARGFILQSQLRNGVAGNVTARIDAANLEKIEMIKGPSATLFGSSLTSYGGLINRVTKKPYSTFGGEVAFAAGSFGFHRLSADINTPLDAEKNVLLRMNAAYNYEGSFQDNGFNRGITIAPSLSYRVNDRLSFNFDAEFFSGQNTGLKVFFFPFGQTVGALGADRADQLKIDYKRSYVNEDLYQTARNTNIFGQMNYKISGQWQSQTNVTVTNSYSDGPSPYFYLLADSFVTHNPNDIGNRFISRNDQYTDDSKEQVIEVQQNFNGDFYIGSLRNRVVAGLDFMYRNSDQFFSGGTYDTIDVTKDIPTYRDFNRTNMDKLYQEKGTGFVFPIIYKANTYSAYVSDVLNITDKLSVLAALRVDHFVHDGNYNEQTGKKSGDYNQTAFSPKFGIVYQPIKDKVALFGNYQNGFTNKPGTDYRGSSFKPEQANQVEGGVKVDLLGGKLSSTISYYHIQVTDIIRTYTGENPNPANPNPQIQDGEQVSKGFEAEVVANPIRGLNIIAGFGYNDSKFKKTEKDVDGLRPGTASSPTTANWWISYRMPEGALKGVGLGFGGNYASDNAIINSASLGKFTLPAYTVMNASAFYDTNKFRVTVKVDNLTNEKYWIGYTTVNPQKLRSIIASIAFKF